MNSGFRLPFKGKLGAGNDDIVPIGPGVNNMPGDSGSGPGNVMGMMPPWGPMMGPMGLPDPSMMMWGPWGPMAPPMGPDQVPLLPQTQRIVINLTGATLFPPPPNSQPPSFRDQPPGCRTIFIGGLPETVTEEIVREMFDNCGVICSLRLSKKRFAHVRFETHDAVYKALDFSGYFMKIGESDDKTNCGRIHVDFAEARDDLYEYQCMQRAMERERRHQERLAEEMNRPPSPQKAVHYSDHEASILADTLKSNELFREGTRVLISWLDRGDCNKRTSNTFYGLIHGTNAHVRRLMIEKEQHTIELERMKTLFHNQMEETIRQLDQINRVFDAASKQKSWDHFTKAQRKNIETWHKQLKTLKAVQEAEFFKERGEAEMEFSDGEDVVEIMNPDTNVAKRKRTKQDVTSNSIESLSNLASEWAESSKIRDENDVLRCQLEAYKKRLMKLEGENLGNEKDKQIKQLQMALQGMQQQLIHAIQRSRKRSDDEVVEQTSRSDASMPIVLSDSTDADNYLSSTIIIDADVEDGEDDVGNDNRVELDLRDVTTDVTTDVPADVTTDVAADVPADVATYVTTDVTTDVTADETAYVTMDDTTYVTTDLTTDVTTDMSADVTAAVTNATTAAMISTTTTSTKTDNLDLNKDARLIALISTFLHVHPYGANIDYIWSYLHRLNVRIRSSELEDLLQAYPTVFGSGDSGNDVSSAERKWTFVGYASNH